MTSMVTPGRPAHGEATTLSLRLTVPQRTNFTFPERVHADRRAHRQQPAPGFYQDAAYSFFPPPPRSPPVSPLGPPGGQPGLGPTLPSRLIQGPACALLNPLTCAGGAGGPLSHSVREEPTRFLQRWPGPAPPPSPPPAAPPCGAWMPPARPPLSVAQRRRPHTVLTNAPRSVGPFARLENARVLGGAICSELHTRCPSSIATMLVGGRESPAPPVDDLRHRPGLCRAALAIPGPP